MAAMELQGKTALVTGASRRVGRAICLGLARAGADLAIHHNHSELEAQALAEEVRQLARRADLFRADLADPAQIEAMFAKLHASPGRLDVLVNNAAVYHRTPIDSLTAEQWDAELAVNARAAALCIRHAIALMPDGSAIVNITDIGAERGSASFPAYAASKGAVLALTKTTARALAPRGIRVNSVAPGVAIWPEGITEERKARVLAQVPLRRPGTPEDIASAVVFLLQQDYITGQDLRVDGGWHMG
jgi:NAD(P)-dependent dehydrogenase (short-subunit alcohol dehydrogenase family)